MSTAQIQFGDDPESLTKAFEELDAAGEEDSLEISPPEQQPAAAAQTQEQEQATQGKEADPAAAGDNLDDEHAEGVATRDGKHIIPYSVLKSERERAARAEQMLQEATERAQQLESQLAGKGSQGANNGEGARTTDTPQPGDVDELSADDLEALKEDFPTVYKALIKADARAKAIEQQLNPVVETVRTQEQQQQRNVVDAVQAAIDSVPQLAHIQATDKAAFATAVALDKTLQQSAAWADKPLEARFAKVVELYEAAHGPIQLPQRPATQTPGQLAAAARAKAQQQAAASAVPASLSDFPAGQAPASDEVEAVTNMSASQLAAKFASMDPDQMDAYLSQL